MANLFALGRKGKEKAARLENRLVLTRIKRLFANIVTIHSYINDAREKLAGEYIFDRRFVYSLVDDVIARTSTMIINATILIPESAETLFPILDKIKKESQNFYRADGDRPCLVPHDLEPELAAEPEFRLLREVLAWMADMDQGRIRLATATVIELLMTGLSQRYENGISATIPRQCGLSGSEINVCDVSRDMTVKKTARKAHSAKSGFESRPMGLLCMGGLENGKPDVPLTRRPAGTSWEAITDVNHLLLMTKSTGSLEFLLHSTVSENTADDSIVVFVRNDSSLHLPEYPEFTQQRTEHGSFSWFTEHTDGDVENYLTQIGRHLMGSSVRTIT